MPPHRQRYRPPDTCNRPRAELRGAVLEPLRSRARSPLGLRVRGVLQVAQSEASRGTDMTLHLTRIKGRMGRVSEVLGWIVVLSLVLGPWIAWFIGEPYRRHVIREGELCSPGHRWTYAQPKFADSDLSCEPE